SSWCAIPPHSRPQGRTDASPDCSVSRGKVPAVSCAAGRGGLRGRCLRTDLVHRQWCNLEKTGDRPRFCFSFASLHPPKRAILRPIRSLLRRTRELTLTGTALPVRGERGSSG